MDRTSVLSPRAHKFRKKKKKKKKNNTTSNTKSTDSTKRKKKHKKSTKKSQITNKEEIKQKLQQKAQNLQQMFMGDNNYWRQYFDEVLSPANRFPLPPQSPATTIQSENYQSKSQKDLFYHSQTNSDNKSLSASSDSSDGSIYNAQFDREMASPPERLPELDQNFYIYEFALLHNMDWNIRQTSGEIKYASTQIERELRKQNNINATYYSNHFVPITTTTTTTTTTTRHFIPRHITQTANPNPTQYNSIQTDGEELIEPTPKTHIKEYPEQHYDVSKLKRHRFTQDAALYASFDWSNENDKQLNEINKYIETRHTTNESTLSETMDLFTNSKDIEWLNESLSNNEGNDHNNNNQKIKAFGFDENDTENSSNDVSDNSVQKLKHSVSLQKERSKTINTNKYGWNRPKVKKYNTIGTFAEWEDDEYQTTTTDRHSRTATGSIRLNNLTYENDHESTYENEPFSFEYFQSYNQTLDICHRNAPGKDIEKVLSSDYLTFELDKENDALEVMINKIRQENELLHEIPQLNLKDNQILEMVLTQLSEYSLSYSNQSLVLDIACDILKEITEIPQMGNKNESRAQCVEYEASVIDIGKTSCINIHDLEIWQNTVLRNDDFISQEKYDINVMKQNRINENRPRDLYTDLKHKTLTIHDPTAKGKKKQNKVLDCLLIKSFNYTQNPQIPDYDTISITYWPERVGKNKRHFNGLVQKYVGHRFVALMKTYITPKKVPAYFKFGQGPFTVERMFPNRLIDFELPDAFPISFMLNLLQQKYVELSLMEKWCWSVTDSSSWMTDSCITSSKNLKSRRTMQIEKLIKSFNLFLKFQGYELVSMLPQSGGKTKRLLPRTSYSNIKKIKTVRTNWLDSKLDQLSVPHILCSLVPCLAEYLHDCWLNDAIHDKWSYCEHHSYHHKYTPWLVNWEKLPLSGKNIRTQQAVILIKGAVAAGMFFKPRELTPPKRVKR